MLCGPAVAARWEKDDCWYVVTHQMADEIAERGAKHKALLAELAAGGSELAAVALEKINRSSPK